MRGGHGRGGRSVTRGKDLTQPLRRTLPAADGNEATDHRANQLVAERRPTQAHGHASRTKPLHLDRIEPPHRVSTVSPAAQRREVVLAKERRRGAPHRIDCQTALDMPAAMALQRIDRGCVHDGVGVRSLAGRKARMEGFVGRHDRPHRDGRADQPIEAPPRAGKVGQKALGSPPRCDVDVQYLPEGMHATVGASRSNRGDVLANRTPQRLFEDALHGRQPASLAREAVEGRPVVGDVETQPGQLPASFPVALPASGVSVGPTGLPTSGCPGGVAGVSAGPGGAWADRPRSSSSS